MKNKTVTIVPIGSSSSGNSIFVHIDDVGFLIDAGMPHIDVSNNMYKANYLPSRDIDAVFVSHTHGDHLRYINDVCDFNEDICLYGTYNTCNYLKSVDKKYALDLFVKHEVCKGLFVTAFKTYHDTYGSCGFVYEKDGIKITSLTDTGIVTNEMLNIIKGSQIVIIESNHDIDMLENGPYPIYLQERIKGRYGHLSNKQCANVCKYLAANGTKHFLLAHLSEENNKPEFALKETEKALEGTNASVYVLPKYDGEIQVYEIESTSTNNENDKKEYNYCLVKLDNKEMKYWYLDTTNSCKVNDRVKVPFGKKDKVLEGVIIEIETYKEDNLPYPLDMMKKIL